MESRRLGPRAGQFTGGDSVWQRYVGIFPAKYRSAVVCVLAEGQREAAIQGSDDVSDGQRYVYGVRCLAAAGSEGAQSLFSSERQVVVLRSGDELRRSFLFL